MTNAALVVGGTGGVAISGDAGTVINAGLISASSGVGVYLGAGGYAANTSDSTVPEIVGVLGGIRVAGDFGTVVNDGLITSTSVAAITMAAGGYVSNATTGTISADTGGIFITGQAGTAINGGTIAAAAADGLYFGAGGYAGNMGGTNPGVISGADDGVRIAGAEGEVVNFGAITGMNGAGIALDSGSVTNGPDATLDGGADGLVVSLGGGYLLNDGDISGTNASGVLLRAGGAVTNQTDGVISGGGGGLYIYSDQGTVFNAGLIEGNDDGSTGVYLGGGGSVTNAAGGTITGVTGIALANAAGTVTNDGGIYGALAGIHLGAGGSVTNSADGVITGGFGIALSGAAGTVVNQGTIAGEGTGALTVPGFGAVAYGGIVLLSGGVVTNTTDGEISGEIGGVVFYGTGSLNNAGEITGGTGPGVRLAAGGKIVNGVDGDISGTVGVTLSAGGTLSTGGTITGTDGTAVQFGGTGVSHLTLYPDAVMDGAVLGSGTAGARNTLELAAGTGPGTLTGLGSKYLGFNTVDVDTGARWTFASTNTLASGQAMTIAGELTVAGGLINRGTIKGAITLAGGASLDNAGGAIKAAAGDAVYGTGASSIVNAGGGSIDGADAGVRIAGGAGTLTNAGLIETSGGTYAVSLAAGFTNRVILDPGAMFTGTVSGGDTIGATAVSTLELTSGASTGTLSGLGVQFTGFGQTTIDAGAAWDLTSTNTLAAGYTLTNAGTLILSDATLAGGGTLINDGQIIVDPSSLTIGDLSGTGTTTIGASSSLTIGGTASAGETIVFAGTGGSLNLDPGAFAATLSGFQAGDTLTAGNGATITGASFVNGTTLDLTISGGGQFALRLDPSEAADYSGGATVSVVDGAVTTTAVTCFAEGTHLATPEGPIAVEALRTGGMVLTASGAARPVRWIGYRQVDLTRHPDPGAVRPIRIRAGALAENVPHRDLLVSPDHGMLLDGMLIPARMLLNGASILREETWRRVTYLHVELDRHDVLLAEGAAAESYLDTGNRDSFTNAPGPTRLHAGLAGDQARREAESCAPFTVSAERVRPVWDALFARLAGLGLSPPAQGKTSADPVPRVVIAGRTCRPVAVENGRYIFLLPPWKGDLRLLSRHAAPAEARPWVDDRRQLGMAVRRLTVSNEREHLTIPLDHPCLGAGWWPEDHDGHTSWRWTDGEAVIAFASGTRCRFEVEVCGTQSYPIAPEPVPEDMGPAAARTG